MEFIKFKDLHGYAQRIVVVSERLIIMLLDSHGIRIVIVKDSDV